MKFTADDGSEWETVADSYHIEGGYVIRRIERPQGNSEIAARQTFGTARWARFAEFILDAVDAKIAAATEKLEDKNFELFKRVVSLEAERTKLEQRIDALENRGPGNPDWYRMGTWKK